MKEEEKSNIYKESSARNMNKIDRFCYFKLMKRPSGRTWPYPKPGFCFGGIFLNILCNFHKYLVKWKAFDFIICQIILFNLLPHNPAILLSLFLPQSVFSLLALANKFTLLYPALRNISPLKGDPALLTEGSEEGVHIEGTYSS